MPAPPTVLAIWRNLHLADVVICQELNARLMAQAGCSLIEHDVLAWVSTAPAQRMRMADLAGLLRVTPGGLTRIVDRAVARGWIERDRPESNRREVYAVLTDAGRRLLRASNQAYVDSLTATIAGQFDEAELAALLMLSGKLLTALTAGDEQCS